MNLTFNRIRNVFVVLFLTLTCALPLEFIDFQIQFIPYIKISPFIDEYRALYFDDNQIKTAISTGRNPIRIKFNEIDDRSYVFDLWLDTSFYDRNNLVIEFVGNSTANSSATSFDTYFYTGHEVGNEIVTIVGSINTEDWSFEGEITKFAGHQKIIIEPVTHYLNRTQIEHFRIGYKSIFYYESDVRRHWFKRNETLRYRRWMLPPLSYDEETGENAWWPPSYPQQPVDTTIVLNDENRSSKNFNKNYLIYKHRGRLAINKKKTTCFLYLQADHLLYTKFGSKKAVVETLMRHVQRLNYIYNDIDFDGDGNPDRINFIVKRIKVYTTDALKDANYRFAIGSLSVEKFLEVFSEENYDAFCLAYMFTYRDFEMGTLGLAWTGDTRNAGGVCERYGHYRGSMKSLNTGIVTLLNYGKFVPSIISHITFAHEIGHNFGSPHDPPHCIPGGRTGNYIMYSRATPGSKMNNYKFSSCSITSINSVLNLKARSQFLGCFQDVPKSLCGNGIVEADEECDCGWEDDCKDQCCFPQRQRVAVNEQPCKLRPNKVCSPSQGPCCNSDCRLKFSEKCREDNGCRTTSFCDGWSPKCPPSQHKPNRTKCSTNSVCYMGECTTSICLPFGLESCQCSEPNQLCHLCCKKLGNNQTCMSTFNWSDSDFLLPKALARRGASCNNDKGFCDLIGRCRDINPVGPLATIKNYLFSKDTVLKFWYIILLVLVVLVVVLMSLCSSNKRNKSHRTNKNQSKKPRMKRTKSTVSSLSQKLKAKVLRNRHQRQSQHPSTSHHQHKNSHHKKPKIKTTKTGPTRSKKVTNSAVVEHPIVSVNAVLPSKSNRQVSKSKKVAKKPLKLSTSLHDDVTNKVGNWLTESQKELQIGLSQNLCDNSVSKPSPAGSKHFGDIPQSDDINSNLDTVQSDLDVLISN